MRSIKPRSRIDFLKNWAMQDATYRKWKLKIKLSSSSSTPRTISEQMRQPTQRRNASSHWTKNTLKLNSRKINLWDSVQFIRKWCHLYSLIRFELRLKWPIVRWKICLIPSGEVTSIQTPSKYSETCMPRLSLKEGEKEAHRQLEIMTMTVHNFQSLWHQAGLKTRQHGQTEWQERGSTNWTGLTTTGSNISDFNIT